MATDNRGDVLDVVDDLGDGRVFRVNERVDHDAVSVEQIRKQSSGGEDPQGREGDIHDPSLLSDQVKNLVGNVSRVVIHVPRARVCPDDRCLGDLDGLSGRFVCDVREVDHDAQPVELLDEHSTDVGETVTRVDRLQS
jgi:hypothetical protein